MIKMLNLDGIDMMCDLQFLFKYLYDILTIKKETSKPQQ